MLVITKGVGSATHREESKKEVFDPEDRKHYEQQYNGMQAVINGQKIQTPMELGGGQFDLWDRIQDKMAFQKNLNSAKRHAEKGCAIKLTPDVKNALWKKAKLLKDEITIGMVPQRELHPVKTKQVIIDGVSKVATVVDNDNINKTRALERNVAWYKKNDGKLKEFRRIIRVLEPDNKNIGQIVENWRQK